MADSRQAPAAHNGKAVADAAANRRDSTRRHVLKSAVIACDDGRTVRCHIFNISETGALLMPSRIGACPDEFVLQRSDAASRRCTVVWRDRTTMGVRYVPPEHAVVTDGGTAIHVTLYRGDTELGALDLDASDAVRLAARLLDAAYRRLVT